MRVGKRSVIACVIGIVMAGGCSDPGAPDSRTLDDERLLTGVLAGQASMPGLLMDGSGDPARQPTCTFVAESGRFECAPVVHRGITVLRSYALYDEGGNVLGARSPAVYSMNTRIDVSGATVDALLGETTLQRSSDLTVSGLTSGSATRTFNGVESGTSSSVLTSPQGGTYTMRQEFESVTTDVVVSTDRANHPYPLSGTVSHSSDMFSVLPGGLETVSPTSTVLTFNGTHLVSFVITRLGETRNCLMDLRPRIPGEFPAERMLCDGVA